VATRILTVEDDERIRTALRLALEDEGWEVDEVASGEEALTALNGCLTLDPHSKLVLRPVCGTLFG